ncbi:MAG: hypothetical protein ACPLRH_03050 [Desulfotomaculales bacterium]
MITYETVLVEKRDYSGIIVLNRPEQLNTFNSAMARDLNNALDELEKDEENPGGGMKKIVDNSYSLFYNVTNC